MKQKKMLVVFLVAVFLGAIAVWHYNNKKIEAQKRVEKEFHIHVGVRIFEYGVSEDFVAKDFSSIDYMNIKPCNIEDDESEEDKPHAIEEDIHLHDGVGDVVHLHQVGATWRDVLKKFKLTEEELSYVYINGAVLPTEELSKGPADLDSMIVFINTSNEPEISEEMFVDKEFIRQTGRKSENCSN